MIWRCATYEFDTRMPIVMGILNVTPDSFSDGGQHDGWLMPSAWRRREPA